MNKLFSVKVWVVIWAVFLITYIVIADRGNFYDIAERLVFIPLAYIPANVVQKKIITDAETKAEQKKEEV